MHTTNRNASLRNSATASTSDQAALPSVIRNPSEHLHPAQIDYVAFDNNAVLKDASDALEWAQIGLGSVDKLRANPHPEDKPATHARKVREAIDDFSDAWNAKWDKGKAALKAELKRIENGLNEKANLKPIDRHFDAITATFYNMKADERAKAIAELIAQRDFQTLATLIDAPLLVTKLTSEQRSGIRERVFHEIDPKGVALRDQLEIALAKWEGAGHASIRICLKLADGTDRFIARTRSAELVAEHVKASF